MMMETRMERLIVAPDTSPQKAGSFVARLESTSDIIVRSRQPVVDGARELLARGFDPATPLTMRHQGKAYDSVKLAPICEWAKWTYSEGERSPLKRQRWKPREMPIAVDTGAQKSGIQPPPASHLPADPEIASTVAPGQLLERAA
jgi:hypothetical protein